MAAGLAGATAWAQPRGMGGPPGMNANMAKFFGDNKAWTATASVSMNPLQGGGPMTMEIKMFMLDGKMRQEVDMTKMKGGNIPPNAMARMKQMGMDKSINIVRPDLKVAYNIFPGLQAYVAMNTDTAGVDKMEDAKIDKTTLGKETIDGHPCEKVKLLVTDSNGEKHEVIAWNATDIKNFPIKMQMEDQGNTMTLKFTDVKLDKPEAKLFEPPSDYTKYDSQMALMQAQMSKHGGAGFGGPPQ